MKLSALHFSAIVFLIWATVAVTSAALPKGCCISNSPYTGFGTGCTSDSPCSWGQSGDTVYVASGICCEESSLNQFMSTLDEFKKCVESYHFDPADLDQIFANMMAFMPAYAAGITSEAEMMMAIAQMSIESKGFSSTREDACSKPQPTPEKCRFAGNVTLHCNKDAMDQFYYGRGYIQITGCPNYKAASLALFKDDRLVRNPDLVASDSSVNLATSLWFWKANVHKRKGVTDGDFGATTKAIHGSGACTNASWIPSSKLRYRKLVGCLQASGMYDKLKGKINESGCYPVVKLTPLRRFVWKRFQIPVQMNARFVYNWI